MELYVIIVGYFIGMLIWSCLLYTSDAADD